MRSPCWLFLAMGLAGCAADRFALNQPSLENGGKDSAESAELTGSPSPQANPNYRPPKLPWLYKVLGWDDGSQLKTEEQIEYDYKFRNNG